MFPRKLALDAALGEMQGQAEESINTRLNEEIKIWLEALKLHSSDLVQAHVTLVELLKKHYLKLLNAEGDSFNLLLENAYQSRDEFKQFIESVTPAENEVDRLVIDQLGGDEKVQEKIFAEQQQIEKRRQKILDQVF